MRPTAERLRAAPDAAFGQPLMEVFAARPKVDRALKPRGTITVFDGVCAHTIYRRDVAGRLSIGRPQDAIVLTGPHRPILAFGSVEIELDLDDGSEPPSREEASIAQIRWNPFDTNAEYDKPLSQTVNTRYGPVEVIYAVMSNAIEAKVQVKLIDHDREGPISVCGELIARSKLFDIGSILFSNDSDTNIIVSSQQLIPLSRSVVSVPVIWPLIIEADLHTSSNEEIVKGTLEFYPDDSGKHVKCVFSGHGEIEVMITWSDDY